MANFSPAELISAWLALPLNKSSSKDVYHYMKRVLARAEISSLISQTRLEISDQWAKKPHVITFKFLPGLKSKLGDGFAQ